MNSTGKSTTISFPNDHPIIAAPWRLLALAGVISVSLLTLAPRAGAAVSLIDEHFTSGFGSVPYVTTYVTGTPVTWSINDSAFERWGPGGAGIRGLPEPPDGFGSGLEVNNNGADTVTATFTAPFDTSGPWNLTFQNSYRGATGLGTLTVTDLTSSTTLVPATTILPNPASTTWTLNTFNFFPSGPIVVGHSIRLSFASTGNGAQGLELSAIKLQITQAVPEPSTILLVLLGGLGLWRVVKRRNAGLPLMAALAAFGIISGQALAATVTWSPAATVSGPADVKLDGFPFGALQVGGGNVAQTVNGVVFSADPGGFGVIPGGLATFQFSSSPGFDNSVNADFETNGGITGTYNTALDTARWFDPGGTGTVTIGGLKNGDRYEVELWNVDTRNASLSTRERDFSAGNTVATISGTGGFGQYGVGTFQAIGTTQIISVTSPGPYGPQLNLIQVRQLSVPEPSTLLLFVSGAFGLVWVVRRRDLAR